MSTNSQSSFILDFLLPGCGVITSSLIYLSPMPAVQKALETTSASALNSFVYAMMIVNGTVWILYGCVIRNWFVLLANILGIPLALFYYSAALHLEKDFIVCSKSIWTLMVGETLVFLTGGLCLISLDKDGLQQTAKGLMGGLATSIVLVFIASPLSSILKVITSKSAHSIDGRLAAASVVNAILWLFYGMCINDPIVYCPNIIGILVGIAQLVLKRVYPSDNLVVGVDGSNDKTSPTTPNPSHDHFHDHFHDHDAIEMTTSPISPSDETSRLL